MNIPHTTFEYPRHASRSAARCAAPPRTIAFPCRPSPLSREELQRIVSDMVD